MNRVAQIPQSISLTSFYTLFAPTLTLLSKRALQLLSQSPEKGVTSRNGMGLADQRCHALSGLIGRVMKYSISEGIF
jgi:hypothetical protein